MTRPRLASLPSLALPLWLACAAVAQAGKPAAAVHDALRAPRPKAPEFFGLYLLDKKVGYLSTHLEQLPGGRFRTENSLVFVANVGGRRSERRHRELRTYSSAPGGKLLGFTFEQRGDGGELTLVGECQRSQLSVKRSRPGAADDTLTLPACTETADQADAVRVALLRKRPVLGEALDLTDLKAWTSRSAPSGEETRTVGGVKTRLRRVTTLSAKENVPVETAVTSEGEVVEVRFGASTFVARAEPEETAKTMEASEVFTLTRVTLPVPLPESAHRVPGETTLVVEGLPRDFHVPTARQQYQGLPGGRVAVTLRAPEVKAKVPFPTADPEKGKNLEATLAVESNAPAIRALSAKLVKGQPDAWAAARAINAWVYRNLEKNYGASSDRATDVLSTLTGDCTEHSLLSVALLRAAGIPARRVDGLLYLRQDDGVPALYWHEWVEAWVGSWVQMDPTFHQDVAHATHLALGYEGDARITPLLGTLKVVEVR